MAHIDIEDEEAKGAEAPEEPQAVEAELIEDEPVVEEQPSEASEEQPDELSVAKTEIAELKDRYARLQAEWDNFRKRTEAARSAERTRAAERLVTNLLPVVDDLDRAIEHVPETADGEFAAFVEGVSGVLKKLNEVLSREQVKAVGEVGEAFDALKHQAVGKAEDASVPDETVVTVYQKGYEMGGKVLRPAMVIVSTGGGPREEPSEEAEGSNE